MIIKWSGLYKAPKECWFLGEVPCPLDECSEGGGTVPNEHVCLLQNVQVHLRPLWVHPVDVNLWEGEGWGGEERGGEERGRRGGEERRGEGREGEGRGGEERGRRGGEGRRGPITV